MTRQLKIGNKLISDETDIFVIAEIGHNHQGSLEKCKKLFQFAANSGSSAVKLQKRNNKDLYTKKFYESPYLGPTSFGDTYGKHRENLEFGKDEYIELKKYADDLGVIFFATPFDLNSLDFLTDIGVPAIKIASGDLKTIPLLRAVSQLNLPVILSTGGAEIDDVDAALKILKPENTAVLQCTAAYPAEASDMDLRVITTYRNRYPQSVIGLSSHDRGISFSVIAAILGARIIEKHFTFDRSAKGTDHSFSLEPIGLQKLIRDLNLGIKAMGTDQKRVHPSEINGIRKMGKMIVYKRNLKRGHILKEDDLDFKSPLEGLSTAYWDSIIGKKINVDVIENSPVVLTDLI
jgi:N-acetylneuraminate synthase/sialic acid synthase